MMLYLSSAPLTKQKKKQKQKKKMHLDAVLRQIIVWAARVFLHNNDLCQSALHPSMFKHWNFI